MSLDPFPNSADETLEARLRVLFQQTISTREPEKNGIWVQDGKLHIKVEGTVLTFSPS